MTIGCNIWMICLILFWFFYSLSRMFQLTQFVWALRSSVWDVFINFLLIDATDRSKISSVQKRFFIALSLYPLSFFANTSFSQKKKKKNINHPKLECMTSLFDSKVILKFIFKIILNLEHIIILTSKSFMPRDKV